MAPGFKQWMGLLSLFLDTWEEHQSDLWGCFLCVTFDLQALLPSLPVTLGWEGLRNTLWSLNNSHQVDKTTSPVLTGLLRFYPACSGTTNSISLRRYPCFSPILSSLFNLRSSLPLTSRSLCFVRSWMKRGTWLTVLLTNHKDFSVSQCAYVYVYVWVPLKSPGWLDESWWRWWTWGQGLSPAFTQIKINR